ncbi:MAG: signal peptidase II [Leptospiraceae bacterium]|nr:signal peptidase II [Leptospiraceae bacterium]
MKDLDELLRLFRPPGTDHLRPRVLAFFVLLPLVLDLGSKYAMSQQLRFHLSHRQLQLYSADSMDPKQASGVATQEGAEWIRLPLIPAKWLRLRLVFNDRQAFSHGPIQSEGGLLKTMGLYWLLLLAYWRFGSAIPSGFYQRGWALLVAGASGNQIDRLWIKSLTTKEWVFSLSARRGFISGVTDFIDLIWFDWHAWQDIPGGWLLAFDRWPIFNLADSFILCGLLSISYCLLRLPARDWQFVISK